MNIINYWIFIIVVSHCTVHELNVFNLNELELLSCSKLDSKAKFSISIYFNIYPIVFRELYGLKCNYKTRVFSHWNWIHTACLFYSNVFCTLVALHQFKNITFPMLHGLNLILWFMEGKIVIYLVTMNRWAFTVHVELKIVKSILIDVFNASRAQRLFCVYSTYLRQSIHDTYEYKKRHHARPRQKLIKWERWKGKRPMFNVDRAPN